MKEGLHYVVEGFAVAVGVFIAIAAWHFLFSGSSVIGTNPRA